MREPQHVVCLQAAIAAASGNLGKLLAVLQTPPPGIWPSDVFLFFTQNNVLCPDVADASRLASRHGTDAVLPSSSFIASRCARRPGSCTHLLCDAVTACSGCEWD
ncbi:hypothetical protein AcW1_000530 [Taiwanofungus camphoratus]|nr:hypothetical protein AcW1_000530 [Antrodia cinnamomea]